MVCSFFDVQQFLEAGKGARCDRHAFEMSTAAPAQPPAAQQDQNYFS